MSDTGCYGLNIITGNISVQSSVKLHICLFPVEGTIQAFGHQESGCGPPIMPEDPYAYIMAAYEVPPSPDYIPGLEVPPSPDYIPGPEEPQSLSSHWTLFPEPMNPEYITQEDVILYGLMSRPLPAAASPTVDSPGYVPESDPDKDKVKDERRRRALRYGRLCATPCTPYHHNNFLYHPTTNSPTHIETPEGCLPLRKRVRFASPTPSHEVRESSAADAAMQDGPAVAREDPFPWQREAFMDLFDMVDVALDIDETTIMYGIMEDAQDDRSQLRGRVNLLYRDRPVHRRLAVMIEREAKMAREAWGLSMDASDYARSDVMSLRTTVVAQSALISELQSADHRRQRVISELLASDHKRQVQLTKTLRLLKGLQTQMVEFQRQHGPAEGPSQPDAPGEASSSS
ncbi:hypothetical protein Tco_0152604 [Tanacetum coccineum]